MANPYQVHGKGRLMRSAGSRITGATPVPQPDTASRLPRGYRVYDAPRQRGGLQAEPDLTAPAPVHETFFIASRIRQRRGNRQKR
jgi:hypothetical protein